MNHPSHFGVLGKCAIAVALLGALALTFITALLAP
jgi:hypothetical protein